MNDFRGNIDHWLKNADPDYYLLFVKAWIPFNAWYVSELPQLNKKDSKIIRELQDNPNSKPRVVIENYLKITDKPDAKRFRSHLAELHHFLETKSVIHNGTKLSFTNLALTENPKTFEKYVDNLGNIYKSEKISKTEKIAPMFKAIIVDKGGRTFLDFRQSRYDADELTRDMNFIKINDDRIQDRMIRCYQEIDPNKAINLVSISRKKNECIILHSENKVHFVNDLTSVAKGCLKVLYALRNMLFHGEIEPTAVNRPVYEHAYHLLRLIIKELN